MYKNEHTWGAGTLRDRSFMRSLALTMIYGSLVFLVVETVIDPSTYGTKWSPMQMIITKIVKSYHRLWYLCQVKLCVYHNNEAYNFTEMFWLLTKLSSLLIPYSFNARLTIGQASCKYFSVQETVIDKYFQILVQTMKLSAPTVPM